MKKHPSQFNIETSVKITSAVPLNLQYCYCHFRVHQPLGINAAITGGIYSAWNTRAFRASGSEGMGTEEAITGSQQPPAL